MTRRAPSKALSLVLVLLLAAATLLAWSMEWFAVELAPGTSLSGGITVAGDGAAPALVPLALATFALAAALAIAGPRVRVVLAVVLALVGVGVGVAALIASLHPLDAVAASVVTATGLEGDRAVASAVDSLTATPWPSVAIVVGALLAILGLVIALSARTWGAASRRHEARSTEPASDAGRTSTVSDWDALSNGDDPTGPAGSR